MALTRGATNRTLRLGCIYEMGDVTPWVACMECRSRRIGVMTMEEEELGAAPWCPIKELLSQYLFGFSSKDFLHLGLEVSSGRQYLLTHILHIVDLTAP